MPEPFRFSMFMLIVVLLLLWMGRRYLGRVVLIMLFLGMLFMIYRWINPLGAKALLETITAQLPAPFHSHSEAETPAPNQTPNTPTLQTETGNLSDIDPTSSQWQALEEINQLLSQETISVIGSDGQITSFIISEKGELIPLQMPTNSTTTTESSTTTTESSAPQSEIQTPQNLESTEEEIIIIPSNPKPAPHQQNTTKNLTPTPSHLSSTDLQQANTLFGH